MDNIEQDITDLISQPFCCQVLTYLSAGDRNAVTKVFVPSFFPHHIAKSLPLHEKQPTYALADADPPPKPMTLLHSILTCSSQPQSHESVRLHVLPCRN